MKYNVENAMAMVSRNGGKYDGAVLTITRPGIKVLGAIDFLVKQGTPVSILPA